MTFKKGDKVRLIDTPGNRRSVDTSVINFDQVYTVEELVPFHGYTTNEYIYLEEIHDRWPSSPCGRYMFRSNLFQLVEDRYILVIVQRNGKMGSWVNLQLGNVMEALRTYEPNKDQITLMKCYPDGIPEHVGSKDWPFTIEEVIKKEMIYKVKE